MQRPITGFHLDEFDDWVADLSCGHGQHVRHNPPFERRPWVTSEEGRSAHVGDVLGCVRCDDLEIPAGYAPYKQTAEFNEATIPAGLLRDHTVKAGVWGKLHVVEGSLGFTMTSEPPQPPRVLTPERAGHIPPEVPHAVAPLGPVRFFVEFHGRAEPQGAAAEDPADPAREPADTPN